MTQAEQYIKETLHEAFVKTFPKLEAALVNSIECGASKTVILARIRNIPASPQSLTLAMVESEIDYLFAHKAEA